MPATVGRPIGSRDVLTELFDALDAESKKRGVTFWQHVAAKSFENDTVLMGVLKKFIPDKSETSIDAQQARLIVREIVLVIASRVPDVSARQQLARLLQEMTHERED